ncbi:hypothetical protein OROHE_013699 [Orobanche hederae]
MNRRPSSFRSVAAVAVSSSSAAMYSRPYFRGWHPPGTRGYSDRPLGPASVNHRELVSGDSHFGAVQEANRGFRPSYNPVPTPPQYVTGQQFNGPRSQSHRTGAPNFQQHPGPPSTYRHQRQVGPAFGKNQQFRPQQVPHHRPRVSKPPDYRDWEYGKPGLPSRCGRFTVLSYNLLADYLATDHYHKLYFHIPRYIMDWNWRKKNIIFELGLWSADILCFQEVDRFQDLEAELRPRGYTGIWKMRTGDPADGCAIFWRISSFLAFLDVTTLDEKKFKLLHEESIEYNKFGLRDNVAQICVFEYLNWHHNSDGASTLPTSDSSASSDRIVVCNIHVLFNPKRGDIKLGQIRVLLDKAHAVSKLWDDAPVVVCGDFNCTPKIRMMSKNTVLFYQSPMYNFISEQQLDLSTLARDRVSGQASAEIRPTRPYPDFRAKASDNSGRDFAVSCENVEQRDLPLNAQNLARLQTPTISTSTGMPQNLSSDHTNTPNSNSLDVASSNHVGVTLSISSANDSHDKPSHESASCEATRADFVLDEKFELLTLNESVDGAADKISEDCDTFLSELHSAGQSPSHFNEDEILSDNLDVDHELNTDTGYFPCSPSAWTPAEIEIATGSIDQKIVEHPLKLTSAYAEVENSSGLRDCSGEPFITSHHRRFSGTVDYIWHTEGLQTAKILGPIPKHVMQQTRGFPTKKWGSDHIALVSEFAFNKDMSSRNATQ